MLGCENLRMYLSELRVQMWSSWKSTLFRASSFLFIYDQTYVKFLFISLPLSTQRHQLCILIMWQQKNIFKSQLTHSWFDSQVSKQRERLRKAFLRSKHLCRILYVFFAWIENLLSCSGRSNSYSLCFCSATLIFFTCSSSTLSSNWAW